MRNLWEFWFSDDNNKLTEHWKYYDRTAFWVLGEHEGRSLICPITSQSQGFWPNVSLLSRTTIYCREVRPSGVTREGAWPASLFDKGKCIQVPGSITMKLYGDMSKSSVFRHKLEGFWKMLFPVRKTILWTALLEKKKCRCCGWFVGQRLLLHLWAALVFFGRQ